MHSPGNNSKKEQQEALAKIEKELQKEEQSSNSDINKIIELKNAINEIHKEKLEACQIRSRLDRLQYMDKPSKYFYDLEKIRGKSKNIDELKNMEGSTLTRKEDILNEIENFFTKLYDKEPTDKHQQDRIYKLIKEKTSLKQKQKH